MKRFAVALTIFKMVGDKMDATTVRSLLYIIDAVNRENAIGTAISINQTQNVLADGYVITHTNVADCSF